MSEPSPLPWSPSERIALWGWGAEGRAAYHWIRQHEPQRELDVLAPAEQLESITQVGDERLHGVAAPAHIDFSAYDWIVKSPGISPNRDDVRQAIARGLRVVGGTYLWAREHADADGLLRNTICVTGTKGKSTTTALTAHLLRAGGYRVALAGNIGLPLVSLPADDADVDVRVIELSSYQTQDLAASGARPAVAVVVNIFPEHLDWHGSEQDYVNDKLAVVTGAHPVVAVLNRNDLRLAALTLPHSEIRYFGAPDGWHLREDDLYHADRLIMDTRGLPLPGRHNRGNLCAALTAIESLGINAEPLAQHAATFQPLPNRLQTMGERDGIRYINDSIATTPHATLAALSCFERDTVALIVGGHDRGLDWSDFAAQLREMAHPPRFIATMGHKGPEIHSTLESVCRDRDIALLGAASLEDAFVGCNDALRAQGGGILLMSPGAPSFDAYRDYVERGRHFASLAGFDPERISNILGLGIG